MPTDRGSPPAERSARLVLDADMAAPESLSFAGGTLTFYSRRSPSREGPNQDAAALLPWGESGGVLAVADGVGGQAAGAEAARVAVQAIADALQHATRPDRPPREAILDGFERANRLVVALGVGAATTLVVAALGGGRVRSYHAGDSELLLLGQRGRLKHQTISHSPTGYAVHSGMLDDREALVHEARHLVTNTVGSALMHIDIGPSLEVAARDTLLLGSDGLFDNLALDRIVDVVRRGSTQRAMERLVADASRAMEQPREDRPGKPDDLTVLLWRRG